MRMRRADYGPGWITSRGIRSIWGFVLNVFLILMGLFMLGGGTYVSPSLHRPESNLTANFQATCQSIVDNYAAVSTGVFTCKSNAL